MPITIRLPKACSTTSTTETDTTPDGDTGTHPHPHPKASTYTRNAPTRRRQNRVAFFVSRKNYYARQGVLVVRLHKDGYFRRCEGLPTRTLSPSGPSQLEPDAKNELRRGLFLRPTKTSHNA